jgi:hypothetical protein
MQHAAPLHAPRRFGGSFTIAGILVVLAALAALLGLWVNTPRASEPAPAVRYAAPARTRTFADQAGYVPSAAEYASLTPGDTYLPLASPPRVAAPNGQPQTRIFGDQAAYVPSAAEYASLAPGDTYLPLASPPRIITPNGQPQTRIFADQAAYLPSAAEYATIVQGDDYTPAASAPRAADRPRSRVFLDELAGANLVQLSFDGLGVALAETPARREGPR